MTTEPDILKIDKALGEYYARFNKPYFPDNDVTKPGKFAQAMDDNGLELDDLEDDLDDPDQSVIVDFDVDPNNDDINLFPLNRTISNAVEKKKEIIRIIRYCWTKGEPPPNVTSISSLKLSPSKIKGKIIKQSTSKYATQTPGLMNQCKQEPDVLYFLAATDVNDDFPFLSSMNDAFQRDRLKGKILGGDPIASASQWLLNNKFIKKIKGGDNNLNTKLASAITGYSKRIVPSMQYSPPRVINDSITDIANYVASVSTFIEHLVSKQHAQPPFQVDFTIAVKEVEDCQTMPGGISDSDDESIGGDDDNDDNDAKQGPVDYIGDIHSKLKANNCSFFRKKIDQTKVTQLDREFNKNYSKFRATLDDKPISSPSPSDPNKHHTPYNTSSYPHKKRFNIFLDRRKPVDEITFYEPPYVCDTIPSGKHVSEWFFESSRQCLIPSKGFKDGKDNLTDNNLGNFDNGDQKSNNQKQNPSDQTLTVQFPAAGQIITFSFHVQAVDVTKCYMFWNSMAIRFYPQDVVQVFKYIFKKEQYDTFLQNKNKIKQIVKKIKIKDKSFEIFYGSINDKKKVKFPNNSSFKYPIDPDPTQ